MKDRAAKHWENTKIKVDTNCSPEEALRRLAVTFAADFAQEEIERKLKEANELLGKTMKRCQRVRKYLTDNPMKYDEAYKTNNLIEKEIKNHLK